MNKSFRRALAGAVWPVLDAPVLQLVDVDSLDVPVHSADTWRVVKVLRSDAPPTERLTAGGLNPLVMMIGFPPNAVLARSKNAANSAAVSS